MKIFKRNMGRYVLFILSLLVFTIPTVINMVQAGVKDELIKEINLVKTTGDVKNSFSVVTNNQIYDQKENKYYIKIDWNEASLTEKIKPNDEYIIDVKGVLLEDSAVDQDLNVNISGNPPTLLSKVGTITVANNKIKILFNDNVDNPTVNSYGDLQGAIFVRTSVDYNDYIGHTSIDFKASVNGVLRKELALRHVDLTPKVEFLVDIHDGKGYVLNITNVIPADVIDAKLSVTPKSGYIINFLETNFTYNDYSLDFFTGPYPGTPAAPSWGDDYNLDYTYTRTTTTNTTPRRSETTTAEKLASSATWEFRTKTTKEFTNQTDLLFKIYVNHFYTDNDFQGYNYHIVADTVALYKIEKFDEIISICDVKKVDTTDVIVRFIDDKLKPVIGDLTIDNVPLSSTEYFDYKVKQTEIDLLRSKGYEVGPIDSLTVLKSAKGSNIIIVHCVLKDDVKTTNVIVKFICDTVIPNYPVIGDLVIESVPLDSTEYYKYQVVNPQLEAIRLKGYVIYDIDELKTLSPTRGSNVIVVHCMPKADVETTDVIVRFIYDKVTPNITVIPDLKFDNVPLTSTEYFNYKVKQTERDLINKAGYVDGDVDQLTTLKPTKGSNVILVHCDIVNTDVTVRFIYTGVTPSIIVIPDLVFDNVPLYSTDFFNYTVKNTELNALSNRGYFISGRINQLVKLEPSKGKNIILVYCDRYSVTPTPTGKGGGGGGGDITVITSTPTGTTAIPTITPTSVPVTPTPTSRPVTPTPTSRPVTPTPTSSVTITPDPTPKGKPSKEPTATPKTSEPTDKNKVNPVTYNDLTFVKVSFIAIAFLGLVIVMKLKKTY